MKAHKTTAGGLLWLVIACAVLLALRKPWALHTPQLWAEDGSIFLTQDEQMGIRAWVEPYNGYLHILPRLIAWFASRTADPAWWPAIYNGLAYAITVLLFVRLAIVISQHRNDGDLHLRQILCEDPRFFR